jgi:outer membrane protein
MKEAAFILCCFILLQVGNAQETWSLERCIRHALEHSLDVEAAEITYQGQVVGLRQAKHERYPSLNAGSSFGLNFGRVINPATNDFETENSVFQSLSASTGVPLFAGGRISQSINQAELDMLSSEEDIRQTKSNLALSVASTYLSILFAEENLVNAQSRLELSNQQLDQIEKLIEAGSRPAGDKYDLLAEVALNEEEIVKLENQYIQNLLNLKHLLRLEPDYPMEIEKPVIDVDEVERLELTSFEALYHAALKSQPQIRASDLRIESAEVGVKLSRTNYFPSLNAGASIGTSYSDLDQRVSGFTIERIAVPGVFINNESVLYEVEQTVPLGFETTPYSDQLDNNLGYGFSVSLNIPIYNNDAIRSSVDRAKLALDQSKNTGEQIRQVLKTDVQNALSLARNAREALEASERSFDASQIAYRNAERRYDLGSANTYELLQARNRFDQAQVSLTVAKYEYIFRIKVLEYYLGRGLTLD